MVSPERHGVPNHGQFDCLINSLFKLTTKLRSKFYVIGPLWVESAGGSPRKGSVMRFNVMTSSWIMHRVRALLYFMVIAIDITHILFMFTYILRDSMMTSSSGNIFRVTGHLCTQRPVTRSFDVFFDLCPNERLSKQSWGWWFGTLSSPLWRHRNASPALGHAISRCQWSNTEARGKLI